MTVRQHASSHPAFMSRDAEVEVVCCGSAVALQACWEAGPHLMSPEIGESGIPLPVQLWLVVTVYESLF